MPFRESRRNFLGAVGVPVVAVATIGVDVVIAQDNPQQRTPHGALADFASQRFERFLNAREIQTMNGEVQGNLRAADAIRAVPLMNADEPCTMYLPGIEEME